MNTEKLERWISLGANVGVLAGIVFLGVEIQQNTETTRAQMIQSRAEVAINLAAETFNSEFIPAIIGKGDLPETLTEEESFRLMTWVRASLRNQDNNFQQYQQGYLGDHMPQAIRAASRSIILGNPVGMDLWVRSKASYSSDFVDFIDAALAEAEGESE